MSKDALRKQIAALVDEYAALEYAPKSFVPGETVVPPSGKVLDADELKLMVDASLDGWLTTGRFNDIFEAELAAFLDAKHVLTTVSGSAANLLAVTALTSPKLGDRALKPGDEVITVAAGFPTTVNPIIQNGLIPVFVDVEIPTYNINVDLIEEAISSKSRAIILAHTLGNPFNLKRVREIADKYNLWLIEDCCDALGTHYNGKVVGTTGDIGTISFYPAHQITMGEGGAVFTNSKELDTIIESFRDWGRDCYCDPGCDNTCGKRFDQQLGSLPYGYDHKYTYSHVGYNLKISDMQAACGVAQLKKLPSFIEARKDNFALLKQGLSSCVNFLELPEATPHSDPCWFGFPITIKESSGMRRVDLTRYLDDHKIGTRLLFAGNLTRQPYFDGVAHRISGSLETTDRIMNQTFWIGVYPGLQKEQLRYVIEKMEEFFGLHF